MKNFRVQMAVETAGPVETDIKISKSVHAADEHDALSKARALVLSENPEINAAKIWAWAIQASRD
jgi:hypothetical protein